jgi:RNA-directed DNA polymerase
MRLTIDGKPETFDFLGFTHICGRTKNGKGFQLGRRSARKRMKAKIRAIRQDLRRRLHTPLAEMARLSGARVPRVSCGAR